MESNFQKNENNINNLDMETDEKKNFMKLTQKEYLNYKSLIQYHENKNNLNDGTFLEQIIKELIALIDKDYGKMLLPFLSPSCHELLEAYINSNLDEEESIKSINDFQYIKIFEYLKDNIFISKENVSLIYSYFGSLFTDANEIEQNDERLKKFLKVKELWKIFYALPNMNELNNKSNFTFIGGNLILKFEEEYNLAKRAIYIKINFCNNKYLEKELNDIIFLKLDDTPIDIKKILNKKKDINNLVWIQFKVYQRYVEVDYQILEKKKSNMDKIKFESIINIKTLTILDKYFGQVSSIEITLKQKSIDEKVDYLYYPIPTTEKNTLAYIKKSNKYNKNNYIDNVIDLTTTNENHEFKIDNDKLIKVNFINYTEVSFNVIEYFGGITQLLPFMCLIKNLLKNEKIKLINSQNKIDVLASFVADILCSFINIIFYYKEYKINIEKYKLFFFCILTELDSVLLSQKQNIIDKAISFRDSKYVKTIAKLIGILNFETNEYKNEFLFNLIKEEKSLFDNHEYFFNQFYTKLMKELFIYNQNWSRKDLFFNINKKDNKIDIKYKQLNYYTKSFQEPFIYPVLEIEKYYPVFLDFNLAKLYKDSNKKILNYDFSLSDNNIILKEIKNHISPKKESIEFEKCCLVKKIYHVKGKLGVVKKFDENNESFEIIFISNDKEEEYTCNKEIKIEKNDIKLKRSEKTKNICYGSILKCPKKEFNRKIVIKSEDILFLLFREYFHRVSAIEIFTNNNKSYYFNFNKKFEIKKSSRRFSSFNTKPKIIIDNYNIKNEDNDEDENIVVNSINENPNEEEDDNSLIINNIEIEKELINEIKNVIISNITKEFRAIYKNKTFLGFYNKKNKKILFPFFETKLLKSTNYRNKFLSNYDILIYINLFANRSFKDLFQYPVFPANYHIIKKNRIMNQHIGLQKLDHQTKSRIKLINESYKAALEDYIDRKEYASKPCLFNTYYSNPVYTSNFLIRVFPYSFSCIELQGDGFDNPNRLFFAIDCSINNTLSQKSDLREFIPELFYFYELFINKNNLQFNELFNKQKIDTVRIINNNKNEKDKDIYKFISDMRNELEKEVKLNEWIDLIFGVKSEKDELKRDYFSKNSLVTFENKEEILKNKIIMDSTDFGLIPFKLFNSKYPIIKRDNIDKLKNYNDQMIDYDHFINYSNPLKCCMCIGRIYIDNDYLNYYKNNSQILENWNLINKLKKLDEHTYYFVGDIFGNVTIYKYIKQYIFKNEIKKKINKASKIINFIPRKNTFEAKLKKKEYDKKYNNINFENDIQNNNSVELNDFLSIETSYYAKIDRIIEDDIFKVSIFKKIYAHQKQIRYIDFNGRLNIFVTYALDGFMNLYLFPSCKLINTIKVTNTVGDKCIFDKVLLASNPFPMIICLNKLILYIFDINGNFIHVEAIADLDIQIHIDKNCGIVQDFITKSGNEYSLPFVTKIENEQKDSNI